MNGLVMHKSNSSGYASGQFLKSIRISLDFKENHLKKGRNFKSAEKETQPSVVRSLGTKI